MSPELRERALQLLYGISECFRDGQNQQTTALGAVLQLLDICKEHSREETPIASFTAPVPELLGKILAYVAENTAAIQSTAQIAQAFGVSPQYLSSYFAKHIGTPLSIYIQTKKIALAKTLLDKGADVTGACFDSGFNDCSYFIRVFKKHMGTTPLRYRQTLLHPDRGGPSLSPTRN
jgi:AraC-like DNA-binding protein